MKRQTLVIEASELTGHLHQGAQEKLAEKLPALEPNPAVERSRRIDRIIIVFHEAFTPRHIPLPQADGAADEFPFAPTS